VTRAGADREPYADRAAAGAALAEELRDFAERPDVVVLGLPRGGVPVAIEVAQRLSAPLDVLVVRKLGLPRHPELAMGAVAGSAEGLRIVRNPEVIRRARVSDRTFDKVLQTETAELRRREALYRGSREALPLRGRAVVVVDDGLATGASMSVALRVIQEQEAAFVVAAVPIGPADVCAALASRVDRLVCPWSPPDFVAVGAGYRQFGQTSDDEVRRLLAAGR